MTGRTTLAALAHQVRPSGRKPLSGWVRFPQIAAEEFVLMTEQTKGVRTHFNVVHVDGRRSLKCVALIPLWLEAGTNDDHMKFTMLF